MKCSDCKYHIDEDTGYSNWTVEGTDIDCLLKLNPGLPKDRWYNEDPVLDFANQCEKFVEGPGVEVDVDIGLGDLMNYSDDPEIKELLSKRSL
jgi:hypothetical protein